MQQPPDPGIPGHAPEHVQVTPPTLGAPPTADAPTADPRTVAPLAPASSFAPITATSGAANADTTATWTGDTNQRHADANQPDQPRDDASRRQGDAGPRGDAPRQEAGAAGHGPGGQGGGPGERGPGVADADDVGYRGPTACHAAGITYRQLDYWARTGLVVPSVRDATGSGSQRLYSFRDIVVLKVVKRLLDAGVSLQNIRKAIETLRSRGVGDLAGITLISDGTTVYECRSPEEVVDLLQGGQGVFGIAISGAFKEIEGTLSHLPAETAAAGEEAPSPQPAGAGPDQAFAAGDELAMRRARRRAG